MSRGYTVLDVFSAAPLQGNALAVVHDADDLDEEVMLRMARETRLSETTFVQSPTAEGADYRNRIFTIAGELPFAGHPSLGTAVAVARARGEYAVGYVQQTGAGLQPIDVELAPDGGRGHAAMLQEPAVFGQEVDRVAALGAAGLDAADAHPDLAPQVVSTGVEHLIVPLAGRDALNRTAPDERGLAALLVQVGAVVLYLAAHDASAGRAWARGYSPVVTGGEDPATGSAAGPLCAYLHRYTGATEVTISQGVEMGRPSELATGIEGDRVRVAGEVVVVVDGTLRI